MLCVPERHVLALMGFIGIFNLYICRINLSMAIVAMAGRQEQKEVNSNSTKIEYCEFKQTDNESSLSFHDESGIQGEFDWDYSLRGNIALKNTFLNKYCNIFNLWDKAD